MEKARPNRGERKQQAIINAAETLFLKRGFSGVSMDEIASAAVVSKQTVYSHFQSKEALFLAVVRGMTGSAGDAHSEQVADATGNEPFEGYLTDYASKLLAIVLTPRLMRLRRLVIGEVERFPELGRELHELGPGRSIERLTTAFARYTDKGHLRNCDPAVAAAFFNWLVMGGPVNDAMLLGDEAIMPASALEAHASEATRIFLAAYAAVTPNG